MRFVNVIAKLAMVASVTVIMTVGSSCTYDNSPPSSVTDQKIIITEPSDGDIVNAEVIIVGLSYNLPEDRSIWICVEEYGYYYPFGPAIVFGLSGTTKEQWEVAIIIGSGETGLDTKQYRIRAIVADQAASAEFQAHIDEWKNKEGDPGMDYLPTGARVDDSVDVVLGNITLTVNIEGSGAVNPPPGTYPQPQGSQVNLSAVPESGWVFEGWYGDISGSSTEIPVIMDKSKKVIARFTQTKAVNLEMMVEGNGKTDPSLGKHSYGLNEKISVTAKPDPGWVFSSWGGDASGNYNPTIITMDNDKQVVAYFARLDFEGDWRNEDPNTSGITRVDIYNSGRSTVVHMWGKCSPTDCDWGEVTTSITDKEDGILNIIWDQGFVVRTQVLTLLSDGRLEVKSFSDYRDERSDTDRTYYFIKK